jgi:DMSO/TMAO reductase YedYZ heme-binding membrane subunit
MTQRWPMWLGLAAGIAAVAVGFLWGGSDQEQWQLAARYTARVGFPLLIVAYIARPIHQLAPGRFSKGALSRRRWIGLGFAISHSIHLVALITALRLAGRTPDPVAMIGGGFAYVLLYAMALTSTDGGKAALGKWWKWLHRFGIRYLWLIFAQSYIGRAFDPDTRVIGVLFGSIALVAAGVRMAAWIRKRSLRPLSAA